MSTGAAGAEEDALFSAEAMLCGWPDIMGKEDMVLSGFFFERRRGCRPYRVRSGDSWCVCTVDMQSCWTLRDGGGGVRVDLRSTRPIAL